MTINELAEISVTNGLILSDDQLAKLSKYAELLRAKNQVVNLISRKDEENILSKHILHSLTLIFPELPMAEIPQGAKVFDLGTGGGLPGIPIKIARSDISLTLCDSIAKKIAATNEIANDLNLKNTQAITDRAENLAMKKQHKQMYDVVITRAVAKLDELIQWSHGLLKKNGVLLALKGGDIQDEIIRTKGFRFVRSVEEAPLSLKGYDEFLKEEKKIVRVMFV